MNLNLDLLEIIFYESQMNTTINLDSLQTKLGATGFVLRGELEDLKIAGYVVEPFEEEFEISEEGRNFAKSHWA